MTHMGLSLHAFGMCRSDGVNVLEPLTGTVWLLKFDANAGQFVK